MMLSLLVLLAKLIKYTIEMPFRRLVLAAATSLTAGLGYSIVLATDLPEPPAQSYSFSVTQQGANLSLVDLRKRIAIHLQPASQATKELQSGYQKLNRLCAVGGISASTLTSLQPELSGLTAQARNQLKKTELALQQVLKDFTQNSRLSRLSACRYVPRFVPLSFTCEGFRQDSARLDLTKEAIEKLVGEANQRLDFYEQFAQLEVQGCTRVGFTLKLWETEQIYLWSSLTNSPSFFRALLPGTSLD